MCRIAGIFDPSAQPESMLRMRDAMRRGGPDDAGIYQDPDFPLLLGHRRLAIIDLSPGGRQPMHDAEADNWIVFNGEIYNYQALRQELQQLGHQFRTASDTEVILKTYRQWGIEGFRKLNGMYAFALLDRKQQQLLLLRDPAGIKPLYFSRQAGKLYFASEVRAFRAFRPDWPENPDWRAFFLSFGHLPEPVSTLREVQALKPGALLRFQLNDQSASFHPLEQPDLEKQTRMHEPEAVDALRTALLEAVERQLVADVPVGLFLSGGLDSSVLTLAAHRYLNQRLHTTSLHFAEQAFSEKPFQDLVVQQTGARHASYSLQAADFEAAFDDALEAMDQPSNDGFNTYFVCKYARAAGLTVALSGLGADELLGGYPSFQYKKYVAPLRALPPRLLRQCQHAPKQTLKKAAFLSLEGPVGEYLFYRGLYLPQSVARICGRSEKEIWRLLDDFAAQAPGLHETGNERVSRIEQDYYMRNQLLKDTDAMSMWHSLEVRVPYLDQQVLNTLKSIPPELKFGFPEKKGLLIRAFQQELPEAVWKRPKMGFTFPFAEWFRHSERLQAAHTQLAPWRNLFLHGKLSWARLWVTYLSTEPGLVHGWD